MKQKAIEWLESQLFELRNPTLTQIEILEQAKEMEKQHIIEIYCQGCYDITKNDSIFPREKSEQYYNETFNK